MSAAIYLVGRGATGNTRFYRAFVTADLLGGWSLVREWGERGVAGQSKVDWVESLPDALDQLKRLAKRKSREGFAPVINELPELVPLAA
ncbi:MAG: WGR domain-containing protein [Granulosicoccaceae bacterium]